MGVTHIKVRRVLDAILASARCRCPPSNVNGGEELRIRIDAGRVQDSVASSRPTTTCMGPVLSRPIFGKTTGDIPPNQDATTYHWCNKGFIYICGPYEDMGRIVHQLQDRMPYALLMAPK